MRSLNPKMQWQIKSLLLGLSFCLLTCFQGCAQLERRGSEQILPVFATAPVDKDKVIKVVKDAIPNTDKYEHFFIRDQINDPPGYFPEDGLLERFANTDSEIKRYLAIDKNLRKNDIYMSCPVINDDDWWYSEYYFKGKPVKFKTDFIIHLEPLESGTKIEIFEFMQAVWVGEKLDFDAHGIGFGPKYDIRGAEPTTRDRVALLNAILNAIASAK